MLRERVDIMVEVSNTNDAVRMAQTINGERDAFITRTRSFDLSSENHEDRGINLNKYSQPIWESTPFLKLGHTDETTNKQFKRR
jgi:hypothetical protein